MIKHDEELLFGEDIQMDGFLIKNPTLTEIKEVSWDEYQNYIFMLGYKHFDKMVFLDSIDIDYEEFTNWDIFILIYLYIMKDENTPMRDSCNEGFKFFTGIDFDMYYEFGFEKLKEEVSKIETFNLNDILNVIHKKSSHFYLKDSSGKIIIDSVVFEDISNVIREINNIDTRQRKFSNSLTKKVAIAIEKNKMSNSDGLNIFNIARNVAWRNYSISILDIPKLTISQIYDGYKALIDIDNFNNVMSGLYSGTINSKSINVNKIHWANKK